MPLATVKRERLTSSAITLSRCHQLEPYNDRNSSRQINGR